MAVLLHVLIAFASIAYTTYLYFRPSQRKFYVSYVLIAATLTSGTWLVVSTRSPLLSSCTTGLIYLGIVVFLAVAARKRLIAADAPAE